MAYADSADNVRIGSPSHLLRNLGILLALEKRQQDPKAVLELGVAHATVQCVELLQAGVPGIHFYTLNRSLASRMIMTALKVAQK